MKKKLFGMIALLLLAAALSGCGSTASTERSLYDQGIEVVSLMSEMVQSETYLDAYTSNSEVRALLMDVGPADPNAPKAVFALSFQEAELMWQELLGLEEADGLSQTLRDYLTVRGYASLPQQINAMGGASTLAASSICTASRCFLSSQLTGSTVYLYLYEESVPVMVVFSANDEGIVTASGCFILADSFQPQNKEETEALLEDFSVTVSEVNLLS